MTEYALMIKLVDGASSAHLFNPYAYFGHLWFYFDIHIFKMADPSIWTLSIIARRFIRMEWNIQINSLGMLREIKGLGQIKTKFYCKFTTV